MMMLDRVFWWAAMALGVPSAISTVILTIVSITMWLSRPAPGKPLDSAYGNSIVGLIMIAAQGIGNIFSGLTAIFEFFIHMALGASVAGVALSAFLWWISRGLAADALWARGMAGIIFVLFFLISALLAVSSGAGVFRLVGLALAIGCGWGVYQLFTAARL